MICLDCGHRRAWHATHDGRCTHEIRPVGQAYTRCGCIGFLGSVEAEATGKVVQLHTCPLCGSELWPPWDETVQAWKCRGCGAGVDVTGIGIGTITAGLAPRGR